MKLKRKLKRAHSHKNAALYQHALDLYLNEKKPDEALRIFFKLANAHYTKAYGEIGIILYREMCDVGKAQEWFVRAEKHGALLGEGNYEYGMLHYLENRDWQSGLKYLFKAAAQGYELAYGDIGTILYLYESNIDQAEKWFEKAVDVEVILAPAAYYYGKLLMLERNEWEKSKKYFKQSAEEGFEPAYEEYASILYLDKIDVDKAEIYFKKADAADCLNAPHAHNYGELLINERDEFEEGKRYMDLAEADGYYEE
jgi:predicted Zn-dependent protease